MRILCFLFLLVLFGCETADDLASPTAQRLRSLAVIYLDYAGVKGNGPANEEQLFRHITNVSPALLPVSQLSPENASQYFVSERDGKPFVIQYGQSVLVQMDVSKLPIAYEQLGQGGNVLAVFANGEIRLVEAGTLNTQ